MTMPKAPKRPRSFAAALAPIEDTPASAPAPAEAIAHSPAPPSRATTKPVAVVTFMSDDDRQRIKLLASQERTSAQQLGHEAWNLLLAKRGLPPLTPTTANIPSGLKLNEA